MTALKAAVSEREDIASGQRGNHVAVARKDLVVERRIDLEPARCADWLTGTLHGVPKDDVILARSEIRIAPALVQ